MRAHATSRRCGGSTTYFIAESAADLPATIAAQKACPGGVAYVCRGTNCLPPIATARCIGADALTHAVGLLAASIRAV